MRRLIWHCARLPFQDIIDAMPKCSQLSTTRMKCSAWLLTAIWRAWAPRHAARFASVVITAKTRLSVISFPLVVTLSLPLVIGGYLLCLPSPQLIWCTFAGAWALLASSFDFIWIFRLSTISWFHSEIRSLGAGAEVGAMAVLPPFTNSDTMVLLVVNWGKISALQWSLRYSLSMLESLLNKVRDGS